MLERPFIVYCDDECSLIPTVMSDKIAKHEPNSAAAYFVCTFDNARNQYYKFEGKDCVQNMLEQLRLLATRCVNEQQENANMTLTEQDNRNQIFERRLVISVKGRLPNQTKKLETTATERATIEVQHTTLAISIILLTDIYP